MRRLLLTTSALSPLLVAAPALAQTSISTARTTPVVTSTVNNGAPADVTITTAGSVKVTSGTAVTLNSANSVKNDGTIQITDANDATGIAVAARPAIPHRYLPGRAHAGFRRPSLWVTGA